ncbi:peptidylprolyl isomerase [Trichocoleus sp. FACHB-591]|uniref:peptidylprolyl isomerase n=1 Tax=Trichocoleus sp. FACHB-591 TaxID=2692872 RepID=UPI001686A3CB|nr:peptidylprolyl isomerase [Trichocoleus sp. FACHB-591]MBD2094367.1 peptidylprolyl isomerase [Trichocoleus sp. FACHB-591]
MLHLNRSRLTSHQSWLKLGLLAFLLMTLAVSFSPAAWAADRVSRLPAGNAITDGKALLRYALPINNKDIRNVQTSLEDITTQLRANRRWGAISRDANKAASILQKNQAALLASIPPDHQQQAEALIAEMQQEAVDLQAAAESKDKEQIRQKQAELLNHVSELEEAMVQEFPFEVPTEYSNLPQLKGRATVVVETSKGPLTVVVDGYSAPVTAGDFVDLVQRGFYDGLEFTRAEDSYVLQIGDPPGPAEGFIDPATGKYRAVPLEVLVQGDDAPTYGITLEDAGRYKDLPVLPFSAFGALALARPGDDPNGGSSQFFFFLFEPELTPAGLNLLDGRYSIFGYVTEGKDVLDELKAGDKITSAKVMKGAENLVQPKSA